jgi:hypothetical protein
MRAQGETDRSLDHAGDQQAEHCQQRPGRDPCGLLPPHGGDRRGLLAPATVGGYRGILILRGLEHVGIRTARSVDRGGAHSPPLVRFSMGQRLDLPHEALARLPRWWLHLRGPSPPHAAPAAGVGYDALAYRMISPGLGPAAAPSRPPVLRRRERRCGRRRTGQPAGWHALHGLCNRSRGLRCGGGRGLGWRRRQGARRPHHTAERCERYASVAGLNLPLPAHPGSMPAARRFSLAPPRLLQHEGQGGLLLPPGGAGLADGTRARDARAAVDLRLAPHAQRAAPLGLPLRHAPTPPLPGPGQPCCNGPGRFPTSAAVAITHTQAQGKAAVPTHAQTAEHLFAGVPPVLALPVGRSRRPRRVRCVRLGPLEDQRGGVLRQPGRRDGIHCQGLQGERAPHPLAMGRTQRLQARPAPILMECGTRAPRVPPRSHAALFQPFAHFGERMRPLQHGEAHGCGPTPTCEARRRGRWDEAGAHGGHRQAPSDSEAPRPMRHGMHRLHSSGHDAPPGVASFAGLIAPCSLISEWGSPPE